LEHLQELIHQIVITDVNGKIVKKIEGGFKNQKVMIDLVGIERGWYFVKTISDSPNGHSQMFLKL
jgi:hypothetical protein